MSLLLHVGKYDFIFIHREATPAGPPLIEWWLARVLKKRIIYDFDDAIWLTDKTNESALTKIIRWRSKVGLICRWSYRVSAGNQYLASFARQFNAQVTVNPTTIETGTVHVRDKPVENVTGQITIGWTGSRSTLKYLQPIVPILQSLENKYPNLCTLVIADCNPQLPLKSFIFRPWSTGSEISDLLCVDIGLMPLPDDAWTKGKCGFKALQYMALEIPAVVSPVGANTEIVAHGKEGLWCRTPADWFEQIEALILDESMRKQMGKNGRQKVVGHYSIDANSSNFFSLFQ